MLKIALNAEDNSWLDPQPVMVFLNVENKDATNNRRVRPLSPAYSFFRRARLIAGNQLVEDIDYYTRNHQMMSCLMSKGARDNEDAQSFCYRFDADLTQRVANPSTGLIGTAYDSNSIPGFLTKMVVGFKPMLGLFNQFKYIPLKACPRVSTDFPASEAVPNDFKNTSGQFELNNCFLQCDVVSLENDLHNRYVSHLLDGK